MSEGQETVAIKSPHEVARFFSRVNVRSDTECWEWQGFLGTNGYGRFSLKDKHRAAHRLAFEFFCGEVPAGMNVCHRCDNRKCVNPSHLFLGTQSENLRDAVSKGRLKTPDTRGEKNGNTRLTKSDVDRIRERLKSGCRQRDLAEAFGVHVGTIHNIQHHKTWAEK